VRPSYLGAVTLCGLGVVFGFFLTGLFPGEASGYVTSAGYQLWRVVMIGQAAFLALAVPAALARVRGTLRETSTTIASPSVGLPALVLIVLLFAPALLRPAFVPPLANQWERMTVLLLVASVAAACALMGFGACAVGLTDLAERASSDRDPERRAVAVTTYQYLRGESRWYLGLAGSLVGIGMLGSGSFGLSLETFVDPNPLPKRVVIAYATYLSILLAVAYGPLHAILGRAGQTVRESFAGKASDEAYPKKHAELTQQLGLDAGLRGALESAVAVLAPLIAALFSEIIGR